MKAHNIANLHPAVEDVDEFKSVTRLIAINAIMEAARMGRQGSKFANSTNEMIALARDAAADDEVMASLIEKQIAAINELKQSESLSESN